MQDVLDAPEKQRGVGLGFFDFVDTFQRQVSVPLEVIAPETEALLAAVRAAGGRKIAALNAAVVEWHPGMRRRGICPLILKLATHGASPSPFWIAGTCPTGHDHRALGYPSTG